MVVCVEPARRRGRPGARGGRRRRGAEVGAAGGDRLRLGSLVDLAVADVVAAWRDRLPSAFGTAATH